MLFFNPAIHAVQEADTCISTLRTLRLLMVSWQPPSCAFWAANKKRPAAVSLQRLICSSEISTFHLTTPCRSSAASSRRVRSRISY